MNMPVIKHSTVDRFTMPEWPVLIYTDLDGTLLDHDDYRCDAARPALQRLQAASVPVIPVTSKTLAELENLATSVPFKHPWIVENGGMIVMPDNYFDITEGIPKLNQYHVKKLAPDYASILDALSQIRLQSGFRFMGFSDFNVEEISRHTGLPPDRARLAKQRECSEPLLWQDSDSAFVTFTEQLMSYDLTAIQGGRFIHVMGKVDKQIAIAQLNHLYRQNGFRQFVSVALGDSPNDQHMLETADIAVVIRRKDGTNMRIAKQTDVYYSHATGPAGWNECMTALIRRIDNLMKNGQRDISLSDLRELS